MSTRTRVALALAGAVLIGAGCATTEDPGPIATTGPRITDEHGGQCAEGDLTGTLRHPTGSVPPPHNHVLVIEVTDGSVTATLTPQYTDDVPSWEVTSEADPADLQALCEALLAHPSSGDVAPGGTTIGVRMTAGGETVPERVAPDADVQEAYQRVVGPEQWDELQRQYQSTDLA